LPVSHDAGATFGFRLTGSDDLFGSPGWSVGYVADLGCWSAELAAELADLDVLALEFNHDEHLERNCGRPKMLVDRVLSDLGHLSNRQAAQLLREVIKRSEADSLRHVVLLHLSRDCNRPALAAEAARGVLSECGIAARVHTAKQDQAGPIISLK
jgi:phosphoribosyl 1,2-cyclic phosphodiesterase